MGDHHEAGTVAFIPGELLNVKLQHFHNKASQHPSQIYPLISTWSTGSKPCGTLFRRMTTALSYKPRQNKALLQSGAAEYAFAGIMFRCRTVRCFKARCEAVHEALSQLASKLGNMGSTIRHLTVTPAATTSHHNITRARSCHLRQFLGVKLQIFHNHYRSIIVRIYSKISHLSPKCNKTATERKPVVE